MSGKYRYIINVGGARSSKTTSVIQLSHLVAGMSPNRITIWRARRIWNKATVYRDFLKFLRSHSLYSKAHHNKSDLIYRVGGSDLEFNGLDDYDKLHGMEQDYAWLNEGIQCSKEDFEQLDMRTNKVIYIDTNPTEEEHWIYELAKQDNAIVIHSTLLDNPFLAPAIRRKILSYEPTEANILKGTADRYKWTVYGKGEKAKREGLVYTYEVIKEWDSDVTFLGNSLDFGFSPDPSASTRVGMLNGRLVLDELFTEEDLTYTISKEDPDYPSIQLRLQEHGVGKRDIIVADSSQRAGIKELQLAGYRVEGFKKYPGSIVDGVNLMRTMMPFYVTERSVNVLKELDNYTHFKDERTGKFTKDPVDAFNHHLDGIRYVAMTRKGKRRNRVRISVG